MGVRKVVTAEQMREIDNETINKYKIPGNILMAYAGKFIADFILGKYNKENRIIIFCGKGNNGGDGFVIGMLLKNCGYDCKIFFNNKSSELSAESLKFYEICNNLNIINNKYEDIDKYDIIVDCLLGNGIKGEVKDNIASIIKDINNSNKEIISVDLPSGLPADGPVIYKDKIINAKYTITIGLPKINQVTHPGKKYNGELIIADIGFPEQLIDSKKISVNLITKKLIKHLIKKVKDIDTYKNKEGHLLIVGGFDGMEGAALIAADSAFNTGVGLLTILTTESSRKIIAGRLPEVITKSITGENNNINVKEIIKNNKYNSLIIGTGMGRDKISTEVFSEILKTLNESNIKKVIIDGDGIYHFKNYLESNKLFDNIEYIVTPHFGEASLLLDKPVDEIVVNRLNTAIFLSNKIDCSVVLKGPSTIITNNQKSFINQTGNSVLATAGSGDSLVGVIGALSLKSKKMINAASSGVYIHGLAADLAVQEEESNNLKITEINKYIRKAITQVIMS